MPIFTLQNLQDRVIGLTALPTTLDANTAITAAQMLDWLKTSSAELGGIVKEYGGEFYFMESDTLTTTAGLSLVSLPPDFSALHSLSVVLADGTERPLVLATTEDYMAGSLLDGEAPVYYRFAGNALELYPTPQAAHTLNILYATGLYPSSLASQLNCRDGWDQWIVLSTCGLVRIRQKEDGSDFAMKLEKLESSIRRQLKRDRYGVHRIRDVRPDPLNYLNRRHLKGY